MCVSPIIPAPVVSLGPSLCSETLCLSHGGGKNRLPNAKGKPIYQDLERKQVSPRWIRRRGFNEKTTDIGMGKVKGRNRGGEVTSGKLLPPIGPKGKGEDVMLTEPHES